MAAGVSAPASSAARGDAGAGRGQAGSFAAGDRGFGTGGLFWAPWAWLPEGWRESVLLEAGANGRWRRVAAGEPCPAAAERLSMPALPGLVDAHSHAFQRAFAGLAEHGGPADDDFWSWRDRMYRLALVLEPADLRAIAAQLYVELLRGGYTQVCEFHYLHHARDGRPHDDPLAMSWALADAAADAGIGLTVLPVLYERAGFAADGLRPDQRRFATTADSVAALQAGITAARRPLVDAGLAVHSLRAAAPQAVRQLVQAAGSDGPIHIHVAEQTREVDECLAATGRRPIEWLAAEGLLDARWQLVHATHATPSEIEAVARAGAGVVLCPGTEANLGDGHADLAGWLDAGVPLALGSDSQVTRDWREELRWLDYAQRLLQRCRRVPGGDRSTPTAERLWRSALAGGARAAGQSRWGLVAGARADLLVADGNDEALLGVPPARTLEALVACGPARPWSDVLVAGRWVIRHGRHDAATAIAAAYLATAERLAQSAREPA